ncbi:pyridoxal phosphate-dependent aminotransferase [Staphylococcus pragensis]|uniref:Pyridoxal phosphate-dependent aminotransferase n=1 Tax=Staphylococcus pragensis TaxID=1611836 RepID=A0A4Z1AX56_9STAP|nr:DegT/DnrJ/EryC1/StrS family aminotransferase [Staphylococcus pragensis]RTX89662.1 pyridoxal phosphate-dependent aminotransferase [Staphylococcus carnosus]TGN24663.1 pyridoxal phosphate-dependent aminotransferase [Staphylococcus pragensis]GGG95826.1 putative pyridoxal phosphate-dependent aminotransferase EpsN [Staphylococcus pragensis]
MENERIFLSRPHMGGTELDYIHDAFEKNWVAPLGENVTEFENSVKNYTGIKSALALTSGTAAIHLALIESGVRKGDVVFCSSLTFSASANPIIYQDAIPVFIDSDMDTWNMSPIALRKAFEKYAERGIKPKAVVSVNLYGQSAKMDEIKEICDQYGSILIEDAAESLGAEYKGKKSGTFGKFGIYSFNGNKIITTSGGGMLISNDEKSIAHALFLSTQSRDKALHYQHSELGFNYRLSNISAGIGRGQMEILDQRVKRRREIFDKYNKAFGDIDGFKFQPELPNSRSNRWLTALTIDESKTNFTALKLIETLLENNIEARPVWKPMHLQPYFESYDYIAENKDNSAYLFEHGVCLPSGSDITNEQQERVIEIIKSL